VPRDNISIAWIRSLAVPYLRGYQAVPERGGSLCGYWFLRPGLTRGAKWKSGRVAPAGTRTALGFFVGYLLRPEECLFLAPAPPECLVFAFVQPIGGSAHGRLVGQPESLLRKTFEYIGWLTHRPPRFEFHPDHLPAMVRHVSMRDWPQAKYEHFSRNFFIETLAWLVRSGLPRKLLAEPSRAVEAAGTLRRKALGKRRARPVARPKGSSSQAKSSFPGKAPSR
jgi:hypothetical protein